MRIKKSSLAWSAAVLGAPLVLLAFVLYAYWSPSGFVARKHADIQQTEPGTDASYIDLQGNVVQLKRFVGKPLIVNVWASWSPFTAAEFDVLSRVRDARGADITIVAINRGEDATRARAYPATIEHSNDILILLDSTDHYYQAIGGYAMPETIIYDKNGNITLHKRGTITLEEILDAVGR